jgi:assimilatory nitrate reductase catalytic subunit
VHPRVAQWFGDARAVLSLYCQGLNQSSSGTAKNVALVNLHLATGQIGRPGAGPFSLTGQPNAMGGREVGGLATLLSGHRDLANPRHRAEVAELWGVDQVPKKPGKTAAFADVLLPATTWGEKDGTVTNSERRISRVRAAVPGPGEAQHDWAIAVDFARRLESRLRPAYRARMPTLFPYASPEEIYREHVATAKGRDLDITGLDYALLERRGPQQWPFPVGAAEGRKRLYADGIFPTPNGRAHFVAVPYTPVAEPPSVRQPFRLNTGRLRDQWHGMSRTGTIAQLFQHASEPRLQMHAGDLARLELVAGDLVRVESTRGAIVVPVEASAELRPGDLFLPMHWGGGSLGGTGALGVNALTTPARCPVSQQPELKHAAVQVTRAALPWRMAAFGHPLDGDALALRASLRPVMDALPFASVTLIGRDRPGVLFRAAAATTVGPNLLARIDAAFGLDVEGVARYDDAMRGIGRRVRVVDDRLDAVRLSGDAAAEAWLRDWLVTGQDVTRLRTALLLPSARSPNGFTPRGRVVCACLGVSENQLRASFAAAPGSPGSALRDVQRSLKCGTQCGSCLPELRRLAVEARSVA